MFRIAAMLIIWLLLVSNIFGMYDVFNSFLLNILQSSSLNILDLLGFKYFEIGRNFGIEGSSGVILGVPCDGLSLIYLYAAFIIAVPGKVRQKSIWILAGIIGIQLLNIFRIVGLVILSMYHPDLLKFNHDYTFTFFIYSLIFLSWVLYFRSNKEFK